MDDESRTHVLPEDADPFDAGRPDGVQLVVIRGSCRGAVFDLAGETVTLGRKPGTCEFVLASPRVSNPHCRIRHSAGRYDIEDLGSRNGTRVNRTPLEVGQRQPLCHGDTLQIADQLLMFRQAGSFADADGLSSIHFDREKVRREVDSIFDDLPWPGKR